MKPHKQLEFAVDDSTGHQRIFKKFPDACALAVSLAASDGRPHNVDVLAYGVGDARAWAGDYGVREYKADPEASVFDRFEVRADDKGRIA
jgi:hypothetical protein